MKRYGSGIVVAGFFTLAACSAAPENGQTSPGDPAAADSVGAGDVGTDTVEIVPGVPDRGRDPAVVAIDIAGQGLCTGTLIEKDVVLTARHCVAHTTEQVQCPGGGRQITNDRAPSTLGIYLGDDVAHAQLVASGKELVVPKGSSLCGDDIALIILDRDVEGVEPLEVRTTGVAVGDHVRAVGYGKRGDNEPAGTKLLREHVKILEVSRTEFKVGEATCQGDSGGPAIDEVTGEVVGVVSRGGPSCQGAGVHNVYTRTDSFLKLIHEAEARGGEPDTGPGATQDDAGAGDAGHHGRGGKGKRGGHKGHHKKPPTDLGATCTKGSDCSTGVCVTEHGRQYCSRPCGAHDRCTSHFHCKKTKTAQAVCTAP